MHHSIGAPDRPQVRPGDFIQTVDHFGDIFFEVQSVFGDLANFQDYWHVTYFTYGRYDANPTTQWVNRSTRLRAIIPAEMAVPVMLKRRLRFKASFGQYDPFLGFAPAGVPLHRPSSA